MKWAGRRLTVARLEERGGVQGDAAARRRYGTKYMHAEIDVWTRNFGLVWADVAPDHSSCKGWKAADEPYNRLHSINISSSRQCHRSSSKLGMRVTEVSTARLSSVHI